MTSMWVGHKYNHLGLQAGWKIDVTNKYFYISNALWSPLSKKIITFQSIFVQSKRVKLHDWTWYLFVLTRNDRTVNMSWNFLAGMLQIICHFHKVNSLNYNEWKLKGEKQTLERTLTNLRDCGVNFLSQVWSMQRADDNDKNLSIFLRFYLLIKFTTFRSFFVYGKHVKFNIQTRYVRLFTFPKNEVSAQRKFLQNRVNQIHNNLHCNWKN